MKLQTVYNAGLHTIAIIGIILTFTLPSPYFMLAAPAAIGLCELWFCFIKYLHHK